MRRNLLAATVVGMVVSSACFPARAQIFKCPSGGSYTLQQSPCAGLGQSGGRLLVLPNGRLAPVAVATSASGVPREGRVLGRTPRPSSEVVARSN